MQELRVNRLNILSNFSERNATALTPPDFTLTLLIMSLNCLAPEVDEKGARHCSQFFTSFKCGGGGGSCEGDAILTTISQIMNYITQLGESRRRKRKAWPCLLPAGPRTFALTSTMTGGDT